jgi:transposase
MNIAGGWGKLLVQATTWPGAPAMQLKTLLNFVHPVKGFIYEKARMMDDPSQPNGKRIEVTLRARRGSHGVCSSCGRRGATYDTLGVRRFDFVPLWGIAVVFLYAMRRMDCRHCGVKVERVPWAQGKSPITTALQCFLARWAQRLSWKQTAEIFHVKWDTVFRAVEAVVAYGLAQRDVSNVTAIGVDEVAYRKGHCYLTLVYQLDAGRRRLLHVSEGRSVRSFLRFFRMMGQDRTASIRYVCSDMWRAYRKVIAKKLPQALHLLDRYHIVANLNKALDQVRADEARRLKAQGYVAHLKHTRWCFLKRKANLTSRQRVRLREVLRYDLVTGRAYLKVQALQLLWRYTSPTWAGKFLDAWCRDVMGSRIEPLKKVARSLREHRQLILNWFAAKKQYNAGIVEGLNANAKLRFRKAYGFRTFAAAEVALYHQLGNLPEPELTHRFC